MPKKYKDWVGHITGKLIVVTYSHRAIKNHFWNCLCECGNMSVIRSSCMKITKSGGCEQKKHDSCDSISYTCWKSMRSRVTSDLPTIAPYYKDKGIKICEEWDD